MALQCGKNLEQESVKASQKDMKSLMKKGRGMLANLKKSNAFKQLDIKKLDDNLIHKIITEKGTKEINYWYRFKYLIVFGSILFLMSLYFIFWYIATDFKTIEESFTSIFCVI